MVVLAASVVTKSGKPLVSRQFLGLPRSRLEGLLSSFPRLVSPTSEHTVLEASGVRFLYTPLEDLYVLLITNTQSNILLDLSTLALCTRIVTELGTSGRGGAVGEDDVKRVSFELLSAWDEVVSLGWRENVNLQQVRNTLEMESHEEKIQEIIARNKEQEAKEELKRRAKQLEIQRREMTKRGQAPYSSNSSSSGFGNNSSNSYTPTRAAPSYESRSSTFSQAEADRTAAASSNGSGKAFKTKGMQLGGNKKAAVDRGLQEALGGLNIDEEIVLPSIASPTSRDNYAQEVESQQQQGNGGAGIARGGSANPFGEVDEMDIHLQIRETLSLSLSRDGGLVALALKGDLNLLLASPAHSSSLSVILSPPSSFIKPSGAGNDIQFKTHPNVDKKAWADRGEVRLKEGKKFPVGQAVGVLKWRVTGKDESVVPISINCWPSYDAATSTSTINLEYELESTSHSLHSLTITLPLPASGLSNLSISEAPTCGSYSINAQGEFEWRIEEISEAIGNGNGSVEFEVGGVGEDGEDGEVFFPVGVEFVSQKGVGGVEVKSVIDPSDGQPIEYSLDTLLSAEDYLVV